jgi:hypothetical protein
MEHYLHSPHTPQLDEKEQALSNSFIKVHAVGTIGFHNTSATTVLMGYASVK